MPKIKKILTLKNVLEEINTTKLVDTRLGKRKVVILNSSKLNGYASHI